jgi:2-C-methyl-D-erythritol 4-phosphate cytidylyltransferase
MADRRVFHLWYAVMTTVAIIPAGGAGRRMETGVAKQYLPLAGLPVLARTLQTFQHSPVVDEIIIAVPGKDIQEVRREIVAKYAISKVVLVLAGGPERQDSVQNALCHVCDEHRIVVVHDGVRPFVTDALISRAVAAAAEHGAVVVGMPVRDTVKEVDTAGCIVKTVPREGLWLTQTPQAFLRLVIVAAYRQAEADGFYGTDDASLVERMGVRVQMIRGDWNNIKVTTPEDLLLGEAIGRGSYGGNRSGSFM